MYVDILSFAGLLEPGVGHPGRTTETDQIKLNHLVMMSGAPSTIYGRARSAVREVGSQPGPAIPNHNRQDGEVRALPEESTWMRVSAGLRFYRLCDRL